MNFPIKGTVMRTETALINDRLPVSASDHLSVKFGILPIYIFVVIYP